jgi:hypothetical protein
MQTLRGAAHSSPRASTCLPTKTTGDGIYSLMQHYGAPTRILDWSDGALTRKMPRGLTRACGFWIPTASTALPSIILMIGPALHSQIGRQRSNICRSSLPERSAPGISFGNRSTARVPQAFFSAWPFYSVRSAS